jgi:hypothetical protein
MNQNHQQPQLNIDLKNTSPVTNFDGGSVFEQGVILRKVSKFVTGTNEDALLPIPVFIDPLTKKILTDSVPPELREELKDELI